MRIYLATVIAVFSLLFTSTGWTADYEIGQEAYSSGDYQTALTEWQLLANEGHASSQFGMGLLYANGFGVPFDNEQALKWYMAAAEQGYARAQCNLAVMHANGWGVPQSDEEAFRWYSLAAEQGLTQAQLSLAKIYSRSFGPIQDKVQAYKWLTVASELGNSNARFKLNSLAKKMSDEDMAESGHLASLWMDGYQNLLASK